jgi:transposase
MTSRYELPPAQGHTIEGILPGQAGDRGHTAADNRTVVNGGRCVLRSGAHWQRYGNWKRVHKRVTRWAEVGM